MTVNNKGNNFECKELVYDFGNRRYKVQRYIFEGIEKTLFVLKKTKFGYF